MKRKNASRWIRGASNQPAKDMRRITYLAVLLLLCSAPKTFAQTTTGASDDNSVSRPRQYLFGDWGGERTSLASKGVTFDFFYVADGSR